MSRIQDAKPEKWDDLSRINHAKYQQSLRSMLCKSHHSAVSAQRDQQYSALLQLLLQR
ncbi:unnamed protein product [Gongylonema pulchrum]|uniref:MADF domain-containing protein n=1 Tax=Gongylonema pulchrum TaxID=637853 RepID=A0A183DMS2_9BILA|nr:unnamed protein product [Gongylonema pulchrum]